MEKETRMTWVWRIGVTLAFVLLAINMAHAMPITEPPGLNPDDQYRLAFVTSTTQDATSDVIAKYNQFVDNLANAASSPLEGLDATWTAIASTPTVDARDNTQTNPDSAIGVPIYNLNGEVVAADNADLWDGSIQAAINHDEFGDLTAFSFAWTGTETDGEGITWFELGGFFGSTTLGVPPATTGEWVLDGTFIESVKQFPVYGLSSMLTVAGKPVPEPATILLLGSGLVALAGLRRKGRKA